MEILGVGPLEFLLIVVIMLLVLGPKEMVSTAGKIGRFIRQVVRSPMWGTVMQTSKEVRDLPNRIIREAGLEEDIAQIKQVAQTPTAMMSEAVKQMQVEIPAIQIPKDSTIPSSQPSSSPVAQPTQPLSPASLAFPVPLEIEPITPFSTELPASGSILLTQEAVPPSNPGSNQTSITPQAEETGPIPGDAPDEVQTVQASEEAAVPLAVEPFEPSLMIEPGQKTKPVSKRRSSRLKPDGVSNSQAKPMPLETENLVVLEPVSPHENGGSAKSG